MSRNKAGWAIVDGNGRLYMPVHAYRAAAIAYHVAWHCPAQEPQPSQFAHRGLNALQRERWAECKRRGDLAVKVRVSWS